MDQASQSSSDTALARMVDLQRQAQAASDQMDEAFAALLGVGRTDARCLDVVHRRGRVTAGDLAREAGLTTGAVTALVDRLARAGYLARQADPQDRRKVLIAPTPRLLALAEAIYGPIGRLGQRHMAAMPAIQLDLLSRYFRTSAWINAELARLLRSTADPGDPMARARAFSERIGQDMARLDQGLIAAWQGDIAEP